MSRDRREHRMVALLIDGVHANAHISAGEGRAQIRPYNSILKLIPASGANLGTFCASSRRHLVSERRKLSG